MFGSMNLYDNVAFPLREHTKKSESEIRDIVMEKMDLVGLLGAEDKLPGEISGGMRKRAGLARALVLDPEIVLFDEPDSGLDPVRTAFLNQLIIDLNAQIDATFLIVTHDINTARTVPDNIGLLYHRHLAMFGPREMLLSSEEPVVRQFLNAQRIGPIGMSEEKDADELAAEKDEDLPPLPPIPLQLEPSNGIPRRSQREPGAWCRENGITPPPGSFEPQHVDGTGRGLSRCPRSTTARVLAARRDRRQALRLRPRRRPPALPPALPAARVHPAGLVHRLGDDRPDGAGGDPVRRGDRAAGRRADQAVRRPVVHRLRRRARHRPRGRPHRHRAAHRRRRRVGDRRRPRRPQDPRGARRDDGARHRPDPAARRPARAGLHAGRGLPQRPGQRRRRRRRLRLQRDAPGRHARGLPRQLHRARPAARPLAGHGQGAGLRDDRRDRRVATRA